MPRGDNPNSRKALTEARKKTAFNHDTAVIANKRSQEAKKTYTTLTEALKEQCTPEIMAQLTEVLVKKAKAGNLKAYELLRDQLGEKPVERIEQANVEIKVEFEGE